MYNWHFWANDLSFNMTETMDKNIFAQHITASVSYICSISRQKMHTSYLITNHFFHRVVLLFYNQLFEHMVQIHADIPFHDNNDILTEHVKAKWKIILVTLFVMVKLQKDEHRLFQGSALVRPLEPVWKRTNYWAILISGNS